MTNDYQPRINDRDRKIRRAVTIVRKKTGLDKSLIVKRMLIYSCNRASEIFPELAKPQQGGRNNE